MKIIKVIDPVTGLTIDELRANRLRLALENNELVKKLNETCESYQDELKYQFAIDRNAVVAGVVNRRIELLRKIIKDNKDKQEASRLKAISIKQEAIRKYVVWNRYKTGASTYTELMAHEEEIEASESSILFLTEKSLWEVLTAVYNEADVDLLCREMKTVHA